MHYIHYIACIYYITFIYFKLVVTDRQPDQQNDRRTLSRIELLLQLKRVPKKKVNIRIGDWERELLSNTDAQGMGSMLRPSSTE